MENPDDLRSGLEAAFEEHSQEQQVEQTVVEAPQASQEEGRARDESGRFAKVEKPEEVEQPVVDAPVAELPEVKAPSSWKPEAQAAYIKAERGEALTPAEIKLLTAEANRRETDFHKGLEGLKPNANIGRAFQEAVQPYMQTIQQLGVDAPTAVAKLLQADHILRYADPASKAQFFASLAQQYGIDLGQAANPPEVDPQVRALQQQLAQTQGQVQQFMTYQQQQQQMAMNAEIQRFAADPANKHYQAVLPQMVDLLEKGLAEDLKSAYEKALWMNPEIRQTLIGEQTAEAQKKALEQAQAAKAKAAAVSVKGSSPASSSIPTVKGSLREQLEAAYADQT